MSHGDVCAHVDVSGHKVNTCGCGSPRTAVASGRGLRKAKEIGQEGRSALAEANFRTRHISLPNCFANQQPTHARVFPGYP